MSRGWRPRLRRIHLGAWQVLALLLAGMALVGVLAGQALPALERHPQHVAQWLSARAQRKVEFDGIHARWTRRGPLLVLRGLRVGDGAQPLHVGDAELQIAQYTGWLPGRSFTELRLRGLQLVLQRDADGQWQVRGLPAQGGEGDPLDTLSHLGELQLVGAKLQLLAPDLGLDLQVPRIDLRVRVDGDRLRAGARAWLDPGAAPFDFAAVFQRGSGDGRVYAGSRQADLAALAGKLDVAGITPVAGRGRLRAWAEVRGRRVVAVRADAGLLGVRVRGVGEDAAPAGEQALGEVVLDARWTGSLRQWTAGAGLLRIGDGRQRQVLDGLQVAGGRIKALRAPRIDGGALLQLAALSNAVAPDLRRWLRRATPSLVLRDIELRDTGNGRWHAGARLDGFGFAAVGEAPGLHGVGGWLQADAQGLRLRLDPRAQVEFDWPAGFGVVHRFTLDGEAVAWRDDAGWTVQTPGLAIEGPPLVVQARGGITFQHDGSHPHLDLAADIGDAPVSMARGFWIHHLMPKATVAWLDAALQGGTLRNVHAVVAGDLDDWPFRGEGGRAGAGVFRAEAHLSDASVRFQPDWPAAQHMDADLRFVADGFTVDGRAQLAGLPVQALSASIPSFAQSVLSVRAAAAGDAAQFVELLRQSPLHAEHAGVMDHLHAAGPASTRLQLVIPLHHDAPAARVAGSVELAGVQLREDDWNVDFRQVRGQARYDHDGFSAETLKVRMDGAEAALALRAGATHVRDPRQAFEAQLQASADIDRLLDRAGGLDWLKPHVAGSSPWTVDLAIPRVPGKADVDPFAAGVLRLHSSLVGTRFDLGAPLGKPAAQPLPASVAIAVGDTGAVDVRLGDLLSLRSRSFGQRQGMRLQFGGGQAPLPTRAGVWAAGSVARLDPLGLAGLLGGGSPGAGDGPPLQGVDLRVGTLLLAGAAFDNVRLAMAPAPGATAVQLQGETIAGALLLPDAAGATVAGRFERLYWRLPAASASAPAKAPKAPTPASDGIDPARIPPLLLEVADLRLGQARMGSARLRISPVAGGLRLDELSTHGSQKLQGSGSWLGRGGAARSQVRLDVDSGDIGALLGGLGLAGQIGGGHGKFGLQAQWRGAPDAFDIAGVEGTIALDARDGQLLEIDPGAGRVLGLLGVAQLRRRLSLDFSDLFGKGFTFDRIHGSARLEQGLLRSDGMTVRGPAADIVVRGVTDLHQRSFDQYVDVLPKPGGLLTAVGALAGGPVGAAVGAMANAVLDKPMQGLAARHYHVTGPWNAPVIETLSRREAREVPKADGSVR